MQGGRDLLEVTRLIVSELTPLVGAQHGTFFLSEIGPDSEVTLRRIASYGYRPRKGVPDRFPLGEGLVGQAAQAKNPIVVHDIPRSYIRISSGLGEASPTTLAVLPVLFEEQALGVVELASFKPFSPVHMQFLEQLMEIIGVSLNAIIASTRTEELLVESQRLATELQDKSVELQRQQEELQQTNAELEEKASLLADQNRAIEIKNLEIEDARRVLEERAEQLALSSRYKSEFLANMSHELRTPLNSLLILAKLLSDNAEGNLNSRQVEYSRTIHGAGTDLLQLINDILDLSKVEAGKMDVHAADVAVSAIVDYVEATFRPLTAEKDLRFTIAVADDVPRTLHSDQHRLQQVLRNLLSNAVKFTDAGEVRLVIRRAAHKRFAASSLLASDEVLAFEVIDTGIGIPAQQLRVIFEAFQQADGTISRKFGGTGLGLSISREIARLIGGEIHAESQPGRGSAFTLYVPQRHSALPLGPPPPGPDDLEQVLAVGADGDWAAASHVELGEDGPIGAGDRLLLVALADDDLRRSALELGRKRGFRTVGTPDPAEALLAARKHAPLGMLVGLDLELPDGTSLLERLKRHRDTRHIPTLAVHSKAIDEDGHSGRLAGAIDVVLDPVSEDDVDAGLQRLVAFIERPTRSLLVVTSATNSDGTSVGGVVGALFGQVDDVETTVVSSAEDAYAALAGATFDCMVLDLPLADGGFEVIRRIRSRKALRTSPLVVATVDGISGRDAARLRRYAQSMVLKAPGTLEQVLDEVSLFLHRTDVPLPARLADPEGPTNGGQFAGKRILIVDDDVRNVFALTSALERHGIDVLYAENGEAGIETLQREPDVDLVLMDIMMPGMDGLTAMRLIRDIPQFRGLPLIALTAKAMTGDREDSLAAGASEYVTKPVDVAQLLSLFRVWLT
jgi:signal transduction histidine kinase/DNA-binding response OmpR family regulator